MSIFLVQARVPAVRRFSTSHYVRFPRVSPLSSILADSETTKTVEDDKSIEASIRNDDMEFKPTTSLSEFTLSREKSQLNNRYLPRKPHALPLRRIRPLQELMKGKINIGKLTASQQEGLDQDELEFDEPSAVQDKVEKIEKVEKAERDEKKQNLDQEKPQYIRKRERTTRWTKPHEEDMSAKYQNEPDISIIKAKSGEDSLLVSGVRPVVAQAVRKGFPKFKELTDFQQEFIQRVLSRRDVIGRESTGQGKTFALLLALLSLPRTSSSHITSVLMVSTPSLANQIKQWASLIVPEAYLATSVGTLIAPPSQKIDTDEYRAILTSPPHILIATPSAIVNHSMGKRLNLKDVQTIAIDEADGMLQIPSRNNGARALQTFATRPPLPARAIRRLLSLIEDKGEQGREKPQMIVCSATISSHFIDFITAQEAWVHPGAKLAATTTDPALDVDVPHHQLEKPSSVDHHSITVSPSGSMRNTFSTTAGSIELLPAHPLPLNKDGKPSETTAQPHMMEAFAQVYAMNGGLGDHARSLLIVPDREALKNAELDLKDLGIRYLPINSSARLSNEEAVGIIPTAAPIRGNPNRAKNRVSKTSDSEEKTQEREETAAEAASDHSSGRTSDDPADTSLLYVATSENVRGLDIPSLSAVYVLGSSIGSEADYTHFAGRLGRLSSRTSPLKKGQVIVLTRGDELETPEAAKQRTSNMLKWIERRKDEILAGQSDKTIEQVMEMAAERFRYQDEELRRMHRFTRNIEFVQMKGLN